MPATNPFPGMDPYIVRRWGDFHNRVIGYLADEVDRGLPAPLRARMQSRVVIEMPGGGRLNRSPDVQVYQPPIGLAGGSAPPGATSADDGDVAVVDAPTLVELGAAERRETFLQIIDADAGGRVVTAVEVLSPSNKRPGLLRRRYLRKRREQHDAGVNIVEIDLLRGGRPTTLVPSAVLERHPAGDRCHVSVCRAEEPLRLEVYFAPLRERLPVIGVPLRPGDADVPVALQPLIDQCYRRGRYDDLNYDADLDPPLSPDLAAWVKEVLRDEHQGADARAG